MELVKQYWWLIAGALVLFLLVGRKGSGAAAPYSITQVGGSGDPTGQQAQQTQAAVGLIGSLIQYDLTQKQTVAQTDFANAQLASQERIAKLQSDTSAEIAKNASSNQNYAAQMSYNQAMAQIQAQIQAQQMAVKAAQSQASQNNWFNLFGGLAKDLIPIFAGGFGGGGSLPNLGSIGSGGIFGGGGLFGGSGGGGIYF
jgi:hypothetical protein